MCIAVTLICVSTNVVRLEVCAYSLGCLELISDFLVETVEIMVNVSKSTCVLLNIHLIYQKCWNSKNGIVLRSTS